MRGPFYTVFCLGRAVRTILICFSVRDSTRVSTPDFQAAALHGFPLPASAEQSEPVPDPARAPGPATRASAPPSTPAGLVRPPGFPRGSAVPASPPSGPWDVGSFLRLGPALPHCCQSRLSSSARGLPAQPPYAVLAFTAS